MVNVKKRKEKKKKKKSKQICFLLFWENRSELIDFLFPIQIKDNKNGSTFGETRQLIGSRKMYEDHLWNREILSKDAI